ncbi:MAG TPA: hypothetical protein VJ947_08935 [Pseudohaliea sp.]|nr:hypothetical protein [Pseudohaliea sp.]
MKLTKTIPATLVAGNVGGTLATAAVAESATGGETVTVWSLDRSGRPPFKRHR